MEGGLEWIAERRRRVVPRVSVVELLACRPSALTLTLPATAERRKLDRSAKFRSGLKQKLKLLSPSTLKPFPNKTQYDHTLRFGTLSHLHNPLQSPPPRGIFLNFPLRSLPRNPLGPLHRISSSIRLTPLTLRPRSAFQGRE